MTPRDPLPRDDAKALRAGWLAYEATLRACPTWGEQKECWCLDKDCDRDADDARCRAYHAALTPASPVREPSATWETLPEPVQDAIREFECAVQNGCASYERGYGAREAETRAARNALAALWPVDRVSPTETPQSVQAWEVFAWLGVYRDHLPDEAVSALQRIADRLPRFVPQQGGK